MSTYIVDRLENDYAVCEDENKSMVSIRISELPSGIKEGDCLVCNESGYVIDIKRKQQRSKIIKEKMDKLFD